MSRAQLKKTCDKCQNENFDKKRFNFLKSWCATETEIERVNEIENTLIDGDE